jgi:hypothetical protein
MAAAHGASDDGLEAGVTDREVLDTWQAANELMAERDRLHRALRRQARAMLEERFGLMGYNLNIPVKRRIDIGWHIDDLTRREAAGWGRCPSVVAWEALPQCGTCEGTGWIMGYKPHDVICPACGGSGREETG